MLAMLFYRVIVSGLIRILLKSPRAILILGNLGMIISKYAALMGSLVGLFLGLVVPPVSAEDSKSNDFNDIPPKVINPEHQLSPQVTIRNDERGIVEEYRRDGVLFMVMIIPTSGAPYYLFDDNNDGIVDMKLDGLEVEPNFRPTRWRVKTW